MNSGLALTRNVGFDAAETPYVLPLDADNRLLPSAACICLPHCVTPMRPLPIPSYENLASYRYDGLLGIQRNALSGAIISMPWRSSQKKHGQRSEATRNAHYGMGGL